MQTKRWVVTYTKHVRQKRKVFHDGILDLCCSSGKVMLYDDQEKLLDSRFLKKDESIESGGTLSFESHLVDVGNSDGSQKALTESNINSSEKFKSQVKSSFLCSETRNALRSGPQRSHLNVANKSNGVKKKLEHVESTTLAGSLHTTNSILREWDALYTSQMTQKVKRYHDGILQVVGCGSHMKQIILLNEDGATLSSKYLKSAEFLETGNKCEFPNYLVEICEARAWGSSQGAGNVDYSCNNEAMEGSFDPVSNCEIGKHGKLLTKMKGSGSSKIGSSLNSSTGASRDVCQVLSFLKKPCPKESLIFKDSSVVRDFTCKSSNKHLLDSHGLMQSRTSFQHDLDVEVCQKPSESVAVATKEADYEGNSSSKYFSSPVLPFSAVAADNKNLGMNQTCTTRNFSEVSGNCSLAESAHDSEKAESAFGFSKDMIQETNQTQDEKPHLTASTGTTINDNIIVHANGIDGGTSGCSIVKCEDQFCVQVILSGETNETNPSRIAESIDHTTSVHEILHENLDLWRRNFGTKPQPGWCWNSWNRIGVFSSRFRWTCMELSELCRGSWGLSSPPSPSFGCEFRTSW